MMLVSGPVRDDTVQTLFTAQPINRLIFRKGGSKLSRRRWARDILCVVPLQLAWAMRVVYMPILAAVASAYALAIVESAVDIVLNSVAVGFIFEFDDLLYATLLSARARQQYENAPPEAGTCLAVPGSVVVAERYSWLLAVGDFGICVLAYLKYAFAFDFQNGHWIYTAWQIATGMWIRSGGLALSGLHLRFRARFHKYTTYSQSMTRSLSSEASAQGSKAARSSFARVCFECVRVVLSIGLALASSAFIIKVCYQGSFKLLSHSIGCMEVGSPLKICLDSWAKSEACSNAEELSAQAPGSAGLVMDYSYVDDVFWSYRDWGPSWVGCEPLHEQVA